MDILEILGIETDVLDLELIDKVLGFHDSIIEWLTGFSYLATSNIFVSALDFGFSLLQFLPMLFIILQGGIIMVSMANARDENGNLSAFALVERFISYQIQWITSIIRTLNYLITMAFYVVNSIIPV